jgi:hypothetical protein
MNILGTCSNKIGSRLIRWGTGDPISHVAIHFDSGLILHATGGGVELDWYPVFKENNKIIYSVKIPTDPGDDMAIMGRITEKTLHTGYDFAALTYLSIRVLMQRLFKHNLKGKNLWDSDNNVICTELVAILLDDVIVGEQDPAMMTPMAVIRQLSLIYHNMEPVKL